MRNNLIAILVAFLVSMLGAIVYYRNQAVEQQAVIHQLSHQIQAVSALDAKHTEELTNAKAEIDKLHDVVRAGNKRLHVKAVCSSTKSRYDEATTQLSEEARQDYFRLRKMIVENEKQTEYLQQYIKVINAK